MLVRMIQAIDFREVQIYRALAQLSHNYVETKVVSQEPSSFGL